MGSDLKDKALQLREELDRGEFKEETANSLLLALESELNPRSEMEKALADDVGVFEFEHVGIRCFVSRQSPRTHWCGYVVIEEGHPWTLQDYPRADVHGGVTWNREVRADNAQGNVPPVDAWLVGFDAAHWGDFHPAFGEGAGGTWRDRAYITAECRKLAEAAVAARTSEGPSAEG